MLRYGFRACHCRGSVHRGGRDWNWPEGCWIQHSTDRQSVAAPRALRGWRGHGRRGLALRVRRIGAILPHQRRLLARVLGQPNKWRRENVMRSPLATCIGIAATLAASTGGAPAQDRIETAGKCSPVFSQSRIGNVTLTCGADRKDLEQIAKLINADIRENNLGRAEVASLLKGINSSLGDNKKSSEFIIQQLKNEGRASAETRALLRDVLDLLKAREQDIELDRPEKVYVFFDFDRSSLTSEAEMAVTYAAKVMRDEPESLATVQAFLDTSLEQADPPLSEQQILLLGDRRARAVRDEMIRQGIHSDRIQFLPSRVAVDDRDPKSRAVLLRYGEPR